MTAFVFQRIPDRSANTSSASQLDLTWPSNLRHCNAVNSASTQAGSLRVLIAGGGTGGHIIPALAVARELVARHSAEILFVGTARGLETRLVPEAGFRLHLIEVGPLKNVSLLTRFRTFTDLPRSVIACRRLIREFNPCVVLGIGG